MTSHKLDNSTGSIAGAAVVSDSQANARLAIGAGSNVRTMDPANIPLSSRVTKGRQVLKPVGGRASGADSAVPKGAAKGTPDSSRGERQTKPVVVDSVTLIWSDLAVDG